MFSYLRQNCELLCTDIETGSISPDIVVDQVLRTKLEARMTPDPERAVEAIAEEAETGILEYSVYTDASSDPGSYVVLLESDREIAPE